MSFRNCRCSQSCRRGWASCRMRHGGPVPWHRAPTSSGVCPPTSSPDGPSAPGCSCSGATGKGPARGCSPAPSPSRSSTASGARSPSSGERRRRCRRPVAARSSSALTVPRPDARRSPSPPAWPDSWAAPLVAVHTWADVVAGIHGGVRRTEAPATLEAEAGALLEAELDAVARSHPELPMQREVVGGTPVRALLARAGDARVLVVGHRGDTDSGMLHGSTSRTLVEFAPCPVVVISPAAVPAGPAPTARRAGSAR